MNPEPEKRAFERLSFDAPVVFSFFNKKTLFDAQIINHSANGMCIKSNFFLPPGAGVYIRVKKNPPKVSNVDDHNGCPSVVLAEVKWCQEIADANDPHYRFGIKYYEPEY